MHYENVESLWAATAPPGPALTAFGGDAVADMVVIGGGFTGLSAALHLADNGADVMVLDAAYPGFGASGRNGGQVIPGLKWNPGEIESRYGGTLGPQVVHTVASGPDLVFSLIERFGISCAALRTGWLQPAHTSQTLATVSARAEQWARRGAPVRAVDANEMAALLGSSFYRGGLFDGRGGTIQPLAYTRGLAQAALQLGARIYRDSPVHSLQADGDHWLLTLPQGTVRARRVILATNAYSDQIHDPLRRSLVPVPSYQVATKPLSAEFRARILPGQQGVSDTFNLLRYWRVDATGRLIMGARGLFGQPSQAEALRSHDAALREIYPMLGSLDYDYRWTGMVAITEDHLPHLHDLAPGLYGAVGYNGRGVAMATMMGRLVAQRALGREDGEYVFPVTTLKPILFHRFSEWGVRATVSYLRIRDQQRAI